MKDRADVLAFMRGELVGPAASFRPPIVVQFADGVCEDEVPRRSGGLAWRPSAGESLQEVLFFNRESPQRKYGAGVLYPSGAHSAPDVTALEATDTSGVDIEDETGDNGLEVESGESLGGSAEAPDDDFEVTSPDIRRPSSMGLSFCAVLPPGAELELTLPQERRFSWQHDAQDSCPVNGVYEQCFRDVKEEGRPSRRDAIWRRRPAVPPEARVRIGAAALVAGQVARRSIPAATGCHTQMVIEVYPRQLRGRSDALLLTVVLKNASMPSAMGGSTVSLMLFQAHLDVSLKNGAFLPYPESERRFTELDDDEQTLKLLYRESQTWAIGHGCAAGWEAAPGETPKMLFTDVMPTVETPSMTPDVTTASGVPIKLRMRELAMLDDNGAGPAWDALELVAREYREWVGKRRARELSGVPAPMRAIADKHLARCDACLERIERGIALLRTDAATRRAFRLTNRAMLLQQISMKVLKRRPLNCDDRTRLAFPVGASVSPRNIYDGGTEGGRVGVWRAFQIAFLLMQLDGMSSQSSADREVVDLIWFPTGGGKTEAYLAVMAFYMFHQRLSEEAAGAAHADGTNVLMRYTLRMLTTQQFQRAASLISAMEYMRRFPEWHGEGAMHGGRFAVGLWIGREGTPNNEEGAREAYRAYERGEGEGNPFVLTDCPWCRAEIGGVVKQRGRKERALAGMAPEGRLLCSDARCAFGQRTRDSWLPVEVVDSHIYATRPSLIIATADKFAMLAYEPRAGAIFGLDVPDGEMVRTHRPPGLIVQDELHLIAGPLGTLYGLYEGVIEALCSSTEGGRVLAPKLIASTATIRGAEDQVKALYARITPEGKANLQLFPAPALTMGDSFFGRYAREEDGTLAHGRLYVGVHASGYGSILTAQVRAYAAVLAKAADLPPEVEHRDPWWTLVSFYNSLRELGGAKTLFDSDIRSRLKFLQNREGVEEGNRRRLRPAEELTSRLKQSEIVRMMDQLATEYAPGAQVAVDACLASSIIEVGVDIDRLSLMGVVGQPKTTAQYIQVTGRVGRRWEDRPGLILMIYSPARSRDRSHFEQFHSYHRRLYERVEPTSATPFAPSAVARALAGAMIVWARQCAPRSHKPFWSDCRGPLEHVFRMLEQRCAVVQRPEDTPRSRSEMRRVFERLERSFAAEPELWEARSPSPDEEYLMLWPGQYYELHQLQKGVLVPSSMRQVDSSAELNITAAYEQMNNGMQA